MAEPPSLLMVSWNRREYYERTLRHVLADPSPFRLYLWDNGSEDGVADLVAEARDDRIVLRHANKDNVGQFEPWHWFLANADGPTGGKLDDDILGPTGWMAQLAEMVEREPRFGGLGGWVYTADDWNEDLGRHKFATVGEYSIFQNMWVAGCIILARLEVLRKYSATERLPGVPLQWGKMHRAGLVSGYPLPLIFAENLDDPRHPDCRMNRPGGWDQFAAYTARRMGFTNPTEYGDWIARDAHEVLTQSVSRQIRRFSPDRKQRIINRLTKVIGAWQ